jgi:hypothetical protein
LRGDYAETKKIINFLKIPLLTKEGLGEVNNMSHEVEYNFTEEYSNEEKQCQLCDSFTEKDGKGFCRELNMEVPLAGHCDFFRSRD